MRERDWADVEAERLYDLVRDGLVPDDDILDQIARSLRRVADEEHGRPVTGPIGDAI